MSYELHLERDPAISLQQWKAAVSSVAHVRLHSGGAATVNPATGEVISLGGVDGDAELEWEGGWALCFHWRTRGSISFQYTDEFEDPGSRVRAVVSELASLLGADVVGDEGEVYELVS